MAHSYAHLWKVPTTAFRFFTVYAPWGRPDMAPFKFVKAALAGEPVDGHGQMQRDLTYVDDLVESIARLINCVPVGGSPINPEDSLSRWPRTGVNIGHGHSGRLLHYIAEIENCLGMPAKRRMLEMQKDDVPSTFAAVDLLGAVTGYKPATIATGVPGFVNWASGLLR